MMRTFRWRPWPTTLRSDPTTLDQGLADGYVVAVGDHQHTIKSHFVARLAIEPFQAHYLAFHHPVLFAATFEYREHRIEAP